jgi:GNAT superfamily N-acetyltransferase
MMNGKLRDDSLPSELVVTTASLRDVDELLSLYFLIYGNTYPIALGTDREVMSSAIGGGNDLWLIAKDTLYNRIAGSAVIQMDRQEGIGKLEAVVSHPEYRKRGVAKTLIKSATERALSGEAALNSVYTTTRTVSLGPQLMCLDAGYIPLGIFPNAHKLKLYETVTLMARYRTGILDRRIPVEGISKKIASLWHSMNGHIGASFVPEIVPAERFKAAGPAMEFEIIEAQQFVARKFHEHRRTPRNSFYPFHAPNVLFVSTDGTVELFAHLSRKDRYCTLISLNVSFRSLRHKMDNLLELLKEHDAEYIETLLPLSDHTSIAAMLDDDFLPCAIYPAMRESDGTLHDYIIMSRTMVPLDLRGMQIAAPFKSYIDQYVELWKQMHIDTLEVFNETR